MTQNARDQQIATQENDTMTDETRDPAAALGSIENQPAPRIELDYKKIAEAWCVLSNRMADDHRYAWALHCAVAVAFKDEGGSHEMANRAASRIMRSFFGFDVEQLDEWKAFPWASERAAEQ